MKSSIFYNKWIPILGFLFLQLPIFGQIDYNLYTPILSTGNLPADITTSLSEKNKEAKKDAQEKSGKKSKKSIEEFYLESAYSIDQLLRSGYIIFNDPLSAYVKQVFDKVTAGESEASKVRIYIIKSSAVNAFTTQDGIILVTIGMLSQLSTEAQLALLLTHEYIHFKNQHSLNQYNANIQIEQMRGKYSSGGYDQTLLRKSAFSKNQETESDLEGLNLFLKSEYSILAANELIDVLKYAYLPFDEIPYDFRYFEDEFLQIPESYFLDTIHQIDGSGIEKEKDDYSTHPNLQTRRQALEEALEGISNDERKDFLVSETDFFELQKLARYEMCHLNLLDGDYETAIYHAFILQEENPESVYLQTVVAKAVYGLAVYSAHKRFKEVHENSKKLEGNLQRVAKLFAQMGKEELLLFAIKFVYTTYQKNPTQTDLFTMYQHLVNVGKEKLQLDISDIEKVADLLKTDTTVQTLNDTIIQVLSDTAGQKLNESTVTPAKNKYDRIKLKTSPYKSSKKKGESDLYAFAALIPYLEIPEFKDAWSSKKNFVGLENLVGGNITTLNSSLIFEKKYKNMGAVQEDHVPFGTLKKAEIPKIIIFDPCFIKYDSRRKKKTQFEASVEGLKKFHTHLEENYNLLNLNYEFLSGNDLDSSSVKKLNQISLLKTYFDEMSNHDKMYMVATDQLLIDSLKAELGTSLISLNGSISNLRSSTRGRGFILASTIVFPVLLPFLITEYATPNYETYTFSSLYDLSKSEFVFSDYIIRRGDNMEEMQSAIYYLSMTLKKFIYLQEKS